ncbi:MAG: hypothetical protein ABF289_05140 [Clostridiales bacterium]
MLNVRKSFPFVLMLMLMFTLLAGISTAEDEQTIKEVLIDGKTKDTNPANTFKGFGAVTCNNSSRLLLDYKEENPKQYKEIMTLLFDPKKGTGLNHVKIEMGADSNTSSGTEPSTMRAENEEADVRRGTGWQFAADAKKINPDVEVSILRWTQPKWVDEQWSKGGTSGFEQMYIWYKKTAISAYNTYGITLDSISPDRNETGNPNINFIKYFVKRLRNDAEFPGYNTIKIIASDENTSKKIGDSMVSDEELRNLVDIIAYHYTLDTTDNLLKLNAEYQKEIWYSEGVAPQTHAKYRVNSDSPFGGDASILDVANRFICMYTNGNRTHYMFQPAVSSFYDGATYSSKGLITAYDPWSGYYEIDAGIVMVQHFTQFADKEWMYIPDASSGEGQHKTDTGGNSIVNGNAKDAEYNRIALTDGNDYSTILVNDSEREANYKFTVKNIKNAKKNVNIWETRGPDNDQKYDANWKQKIGQIVPIDNKDGSYTYKFTVKPNSMITLTTTTDQLEYTRKKDIPKRELLELPYKDDFEYSYYKNFHGVNYIERRSGTPRYTTDQGGAFEVQNGIGKSGNGLKQIITESIKPGQWGSTPEPYTILGDNRWVNYTTSIDFKLDMTSEGTSANYAGIGVRHLFNHHSANNQSGYKFNIDKDGNWKFIKLKNIISSGQVAEFDPLLWHKISLTADENTITAYLDGVETYSYKDTSNIALNGQICIMSGYYNTIFDNLKVNQLNENPMYVAEKIDDLDSRIAYEGNWNKSISAGYARYNRTLTTGNLSDVLTVEHAEKTTEAGILNKFYYYSPSGKIWGSNSDNTWSQEEDAYAELEFKGNGIKLYGYCYSGNGYGTVYLDDEEVAEANYHDPNGGNPVYEVKNLDFGKHKIRVKVKTGFTSISRADILGALPNAVPTSFSVKFNGTGFNLVGDTNNSIIDVYIDSKLVDENVIIDKTELRGTSYNYRGLKNKKHLLKVVVKEGSFSIDTFDPTVNFLCKFTPN